MRQETQESMPAPVKEWIRRKASAMNGSSSELCGLIRIDPDGNWHVIDIPNRSMFDGEFTMSPEDLLGPWNLYDDQIVGVWHTHPRGNPKPSDKDRVFAPAGLRYWIATFEGVYEYDMSQVPPILIER